MSVYLDVPFVSQLNVNNLKLNDPTGCWYASCCMVAFHFEAGPRLGVPELYTPDHGHLPIGGNDASRVLRRKAIDATSGGEKIMAEREHLEPVPILAMDRGLNELEMLMRMFGPIYFAWTKTHGGQSYGHISVLIGIDDASGEVIYHDPEDAPNSRMPLATYDSLRMRGMYDMLRRIGVNSSTVRIRSSPAPAASPRP